MRMRRRRVPLTPEINLQDAFLEDVLNKEILVTVLLNSKLKVNGRIKMFDQFCVTIATQHGEQVIYKQSIATIALPRGQRFYIPIKKREVPLPSTADETASGADVTTATEPTTATAPTTEPSPSA